MRARRAVAALAAALLLVGAAPAAAGDPPPEGACTLGLDLPEKIVRTGPRQAVVVTLRDPCGVTHRSEFVVEGPGSASYEVLFGPQPDGTGQRFVVDSSWPAGTYVSRLVEALGPVVLPLEDRAVVKFGSRASLTASRSGSRVLLRTCLAVYSDRASRWLSWTSARSTLQQQRRDGTWAYVGTTASDARGCSTRAVENRYQGTYRAVSWDTYRVFGRTTPSARA
ncbi:hypothetical protein [Vallicoccus soli]|uniref:Tat pathway signal sequence domain protein n=1 Tax=Vallicoccus soli TaxID=2339232 RepID=A0A3A3ZHW9_9ACTN|nr:hypothetical protein [Vallicoccus soli]RJK94916.1 hypothetical protein D5H78_14095 [Vallicoccus soli]